MSCRPSSNFRPSHFPRLVGLVLGPGLAFAQTSTWDGGGSNDNWSTGGNWVSNVAPTAGINAVIRFDGSTRLTPQQNNGASFRLNSLVFLAPAGGFTVGGTGGLDFRTNASGALPSITQASAVSQTVALKPLTLTNNLELVASGDGPLILTGTLTGPGAVTLKGGTAAGVTQRVTLGGSNANDFAGGLVLGTDPQAGPAELSLATDGALGSGAFTMVSGNTLRNATAAGRTVGNDFTLTVSSSGGSFTFAGSHPLIFGGAVNVQAAPKTLQVDVSELRWNGPVSGTAALVKTGPGQLIFNATTNPGYTGQIFLNAGSLRAGSATSLATAILTLNIAGGFSFPGSNLSLGGLDGPADFTGPTGTLTLGRAGGGGIYTGALVPRSTTGYGRGSLRLQNALAGARGVVETNSGATSGKPPAQNALAGARGVVETNSGATSGKPPASEGVSGRSASSRRTTGPRRGRLRLWKALAGWARGLGRRAWSRGRRPPRAD